MAQIIPIVPKFPPKMAPQGSQKDCLFMGSSTLHDLC